MGANSALVLSGAITEPDLLATAEAPTGRISALADIAELHEMLFPALSLTQGK